MYFQLFLRIPYVFQTPVHAHAIPVFNVLTVAEGQSSAPPYMPSAADLPHMGNPQSHLWHVLTSYSSYRMCMYLLYSTYVPTGPV